MSGTIGHRFYQRARCAVALVIRVLTYLVIAALAIPALVIFVGGTYALSVKMGLAAFVVGVAAVTGGIAIFMAILFLVAWAFTVSCKL